VPEKLQIIYYRHNVLTIRENIFMNCLIVDDDIVFQNTIKQYVEETDFLKLVSICNSAIEASNFLNKEKIDLLFLDIEMPEMTGLELIKSMSVLPSVILITSNHAYALEAFEYDVVDYLLKPVTYPRFIKAVKKAQVKYQRRAKKKGDIYVKSNSSLIKISNNEIAYIEALGDYIVIHTPAKKYTIYSTLKSFIEKLPEDDFIRVHRSFVVRIDQITAIDDFIVMVGQKNIPVSRSCKDHLIARLNLI